MRFEVFEDLATVGVWAASFLGRRVVVDECTVMKAKRMNGRNASLLKVDVT